jgi:hypothetical protein
MEKIYGCERRDDRLIVLGTKRAVLIYGFGEDESGSYSWRHSFSHVPDRRELLEFLDQHIDSLTRERILSGMVYDGCAVWLSLENQANYTSSLAVVTATGQGLPCRFKLQDPADGSDVYRDFADIASLSDFVMSVRSHIDGCVRAGWNEKDALRTAAWLPA